ncbi:MAG TPA: DNA polymerase ligase N-terminal domain-containing protein [Gemmatimonadaceae bacterium]|nr:DNA polymerase ligase N-terminal domain-containing protein [Gemmatimonadaceae bacterium]
MPSKKPSAREQLTEYRRKRDFSRTGEPEGGKKRAKAAKKLDFVIQKHAASHLHFDLRLELDGVMKSWAVPKGPSPDPSIKRLAMQVEDHPIEYNTFEGTIPQGEYGGGTVMLWDRGWYEPEKGGGEDGVREGYKKGDLKVVFHGKRMKGSWVLVRTRGWGGSSGGGKPSWLLIKHRDEYAESGDALVERHMTSVVTKRTMEQIGGSVKSRVWRSNRGSGDDDSAPARPRRTKSVAEARAERAAKAKKS